MNGIKETLESRLTKLKNNGAHRFDPVRYCYCASLARRTMGKSEAVCRIIEQKALKDLDGFEDSFKQAAIETADIVAQVFSTFPDSTERIQQLFEDGDFRGVRQLAIKLENGNYLQALILLNKWMEASGSFSDENNASLSLHDFLQKQEEEVVQSVEDSLRDESIPQSRKDVSLKSFQQLKETLSKHYYQKLVRHARKECPENAGPMNAQMLTTRSLSAMENLSPNYLNRIVSYIDTLLALEEAAQ